MQKNTLDNKNRSWQYAHSLNKSFRKRELQRITRENQNILKRIQQREPNYNHLQWEEDRRLHESYLTNICEYPYRGKRRGQRDQTMASDMYYGDTMQRSDSGQFDYGSRGDTSHLMSGGSGNY